MDNMEILEKKCLSRGYGISKLHSRSDENVLFAAIKDKTLIIFVKEKKNSMLEQYYKRVYSDYKARTKIVKVGSANPTLEQACSYMEDKQIGRVESIGTHDLGVYVYGKCKILKEACECFIPDFPRDYKCSFYNCKDYRESLKKNTETW